MYRSLSLGVLTALASVFSGSAAFAASFNNDYSSLPVYGEATINGITAKVTRGINPGDTAGTQGAFSEFYGKNTVTIDFNSPATQVGENKYTFGNDKVTYTFEKGMSTRSGKTGVYNNVWAPAGANGERNKSDYLAVFKGNSVTIDLAEELNYFGIDWGALSPNNDFAFYKDGVQVSEFTYNDVNPIAPVRAAHQRNEGNGYIHFFAEDAAATFNQIVISQSGGGGFETDNHSFRFGNDGFDFENPDEPSEDVPEPTALVGLIAIGGLLVRRNMFSAS
ncbi:MAG: PEP-CTERM sorting domain-containing protein [Leptolyngbya sp. SIO3F4]|nr:PEP-CTERM sorting domain-containing protein [Leptolyngbya sp. SIO3F4]